MPDLKEIAQRAKEESDAKREEMQQQVQMMNDLNTTTSEYAVNTVEPQSPLNEEEPSFVDADDSIITDIPEEEEEGGAASVSAGGISDLKAELMAKKQQEETPSVPVEEGTVIEGVRAVTMEEIKDQIGAAVKEIGIPADSADVEANAVLTMMGRYRKRLLVEEGLDEVELNEALAKRLNKEIDALKVKYGKKNNVVVIEVPESEAEKVTFTDAQERKLEKATKIQLVKVESKNLNTMKVKNFEKSETKLKYIQAMNSPYMSKYNIPLPLTGEFATFRGALLIEMLQSRSTEDESTYSIIRKKASLAYHHYVEGVNYKIKDEKGITIMSFEDFMKHFRYQDLDLMVYAVTCASSGPMTVSDLQCAKCGKSFSHEFALSSLLKMDNTPEKIRETYENIITHHTQLKYMETLKEEQDTLVRCESPITKYIYDIGTPSIDRALGILSLEGVENEAVEYYIASIALFVHAMYIYDEEDDSYIHVNAEEYETLMDALKMLPQAELSILNEMVTEMSYSPEFIMDSKCPECGSDLRNNLPVNDLVFFVSPETSVEMKK